MNTSDLDKALKAIEAKLSDLEKAFNYYEGSVEERFASAKLKRALSKHGVEFKINYCEVVVHSVLDRLEIASVSSADQSAASALQEIWDANEMDTESNEVHRLTLAHGEGYVMVWPGDDGTPEITWNSPKTTHMFYDPENPRKKAYAAKVWVEGNLTRVNLYYADRVEKYITASEQKDAPFIPYEVEGEAWPLTHDFGEVPVFHFRTRKPHGIPEHRNAYGPQDMINKLVINQMATSDYHGAPQRYALANDPSGDGSGEFDDYDDDGNEGTTLTSGPGELWFMNGVKEVGQFDSADAAAFLEPMKQYIKSLATTTHTPVHLFEGMSGSNISGEALRAAEAPLIKKVITRQQLFGTTWREVFTFALRLMGKDGKPRIEWASPNSNSDRAIWEVNQAKKDFGIPMKTVLLEAGYPEEMAEFIVDSYDSGNGELDKLNKLGNALQKMALAVQLGIVSAEDVRIMVADALDDTE